MTNATKTASLTKTYQPKTIADLMGQAFVRMVLGSFAACPRPAAFLFTGPTGVGKTSAALALANDLGVHSVAGLWHIEAGQQDGEMMDMLANELRFAPMAGWRVVIIEEADYMVRCPKASHRWLSILDSIPARTVFIFTTNHPEKFPQRFLDRTEEVAFSGNPATMASDARELVAKVWTAETGRTDAPSFTDAEMTEDGMISFRRVLQKLAPMVRDAQTMKETFALTPKMEAPVSLFQAAMIRTNRGTFRKLVEKPAYERCDASVKPEVVETIAPTTSPTGQVDPTIRISPRTGKPVRQYKKQFPATQAVAEVAKVAEMVAPAVEIIAPAPITPIEVAPMTTSTTLDQKWAGYSESFRQDLTEVAEMHGKTVAEVHAAFLEFMRDRKKIDRPPTMIAFHEWYAARVTPVVVETIEVQSDPRPLPATSDAGSARDSDHSTDLSGFVFSADATRRDNGQDTRSPGISAPTVDVSTMILDCGMNLPIGGHRACHMEYHTTTGIVGYMAQPWAQGWTDGVNGVVNDLLALASDPSYAEGWLAARGQEPVEVEAETAPQSAPTTPEGWGEIEGGEEIEPAIDPSPCCDSTEAQPCKACTPPDRRQVKPAGPKPSDGRPVKASLTLNIDNGKRARDYGLTVCDNASRFLIDTGLDDTYEVMLGRGQTTCSCPDFTERSWVNAEGCKHIKALRAIGLVPQVEWAEAEVREEEEARELAYA